MLLQLYFCALSLSFVSLIHSYIRFFSSCVEQMHTVCKVDYGINVMPRYSYFTKDFQCKTASDGVPSASQRTRFVTLYSEKYSMILFHCIKVFPFQGIIFVFSCACCFDRLQYGYHPHSGLPYVCCSWRGAKINRALATDFVETKTFDGKRRRKKVPCAHVVFHLRIFISFLRLKSFIWRSFHK